MTGYRRAKSRKTTEGMVRARELARERSQPTPEGIAIAKERIGASPALARKAYRLAERSGIPGGGPAMLTMATLAECSERGTFAPSPVPATGLPAVDGDGTGRSVGAVYDFRHGVQRIA